MPPWPLKIWPESFTPTSLFISDSLKSPNWPKMPVILPKTRLSYKLYDTPSKSNLKATKNVKTVPDVDAYETTYFEFPGDFTTNLKNSKKFLQISVGVSTQYDEKVIEMVDQHQLALRSVILSVISDFSEETISGSEGKNALSEKLLKEMNAKLESLKEFPGIEGVYFTSFVVQ